MVTVEWHVCFLLQVPVCLSVCVLPCVHTCVCACGGLDVFPLLSALCVHALPALWSLLHKVTYPVYSSDVRAMGSSCPGSSTRCWPSSLKGAGN